MPQHQRERLQAEWRLQRSDLVALLKSEVAQSDLLRRILISGPFPGMGTGDPDLYKGFVWRLWALINDGVGRPVVVLPRSVFSTKGASNFRKRIIQAGIVRDVSMLLNTAE